jgi:hypothetical protein
MNLFPILIGVLGLLVIVAWVAAVMAALQIVGLAPKGEKMRTYGQLGWWQFDKIRATIGPAADLPIRTYQRAFIVFIVIVVLGAAGGVLLGTQPQT